MIHSSPSNNVSNKTIAHIQVDQAGSEHTAIIIDHNFFEDNDRTAIKDILQENCLAEIHLHLLCTNFTLNVTDERIHRSIHLSKN